MRAWFRSRRLQYAAQEVEVLSLREMLHFGRNAWDDPERICKSGRYVQREVGWGRGRCTTPTLRLCGSPSMCACTRAHVHGRMGVGVCGWVGGAVQVPACHVRCAPTKQASRAGGRQAPQEVAGLAMPCTSRCTLPTTTATTTSPSACPPAPSPSAFDPRGGGGGVGRAVAAVAQLPKRLARRLLDLQLLP